MSNDAPRLDTDLVIIRALERGITLADFEILTIGMILDIIIEWNNANTNDENTVREPTQADFDNF